MMFSSGITGSLSFRENQDPPGREIRAQSTVEGSETELREFISI
jgi:hypothetical protein